MRYVPFLITTLVTIALIILFNSTLLLPAPLGKILSPQHGIWQNAEPADQDYNEQVSIPGLKAAAEVYIDDRLVPHVFAQNAEDVYFIQGYLHAKFRLWQMEFQTHVAAGRLCEVLGDEVNGNNLLNAVDRQFRRLGMGYAAEKALEESEKDAETKAEMDAYTAGINAWISRLPESQLPIEYKLLGYKPEPWTNLKSSLFLKYMSLDLAGSEDDFEYTNARTVFGWEDFQKLFPTSQDSLDPILPKGTLFEQAGLALKIPVDADSLYFQRKDSTAITQTKPDRDNGSNNWAVAGSKTKSGAPILCNDPHLGLNLPSLWFEMQLSGPGYNAYGATFPGAPAVVIGFNDSCAFGFTNAMRDVRDYYEIRFRDESRKEYFFNGEWQPTEFRYERIRIKGKPDFVDTVAYTLFGPVMYDTTYDGKRNTGGRNYSVRWKAHDKGNALKMFTLLNRARNYDDYYSALQYLDVPGQNCLFASKAGDIAIWNQGSFPAKWARQGDFIMPGTDSSYMWQGTIPQAENPHEVNPERGFISSANQYPVDPSVYPYFLGGSYPPYRGITINRHLSSMSDITAQDMMKMQTDNYNVFAEMARPLLTKYIQTGALSEAEKKCYDILRSWNLRNDPDERGATVFVLTWDSLETEVFSDEYAQTDLTLPWPHESTLLEILLKDSAFRFIENINTPETETTASVITAAFKKAAAKYIQLESSDDFLWWDFKNTGIMHLARIPSFSSVHLPIGGGQHIINATKSDHGPSWRMIVHLSRETEAYGIYPGGQSGNPGSRYYDDYVEDWVKGSYKKLWMMKKEQAADKRIKWIMTFNKGA
ncbi:MAG: penicillin acylase family protein [Chitinophagaceae bacterium]|nr:penicillin acylase family protein [Chitinophagaceae bacterium]